MKPDASIQKVIDMYSNGISMKQIGFSLNISPQKIRRILITFCGYTTSRIRTINEMYDTGMSIDEIAEHLELTRKVVINNLPYTKGIYNLESPSRNAQNIRKWRSKIAGRSTREKS